MGKTKIEWATHSWNPVTGCLKISEGCKNCYAERMSKRLAGRCGYPKGESFRVTFHPDRLDEPFRWHKSRRVFICSMGDLFHDDVKEEWIKEVLFPVYTLECHTWMVLTKRPKNLKIFYECCGLPDNLLIGVTTENQKTAEERIPILLNIPAKHHFISCEPLLGEIDFSFLPECGAELDWIIVGGESGSGARPMNPEWARNIRDQCQAAGVSFLFKQFGAWKPVYPPLPRGFKLGSPKVHEWHCQYPWARGEPFSIKVGKKKAGRELDDKEWNEFPVF